MECITPNFAVLFWIIIAFVAIFDGILKLFAMWRAARNNQSGWYVCLAIFNTCGILPIIYLIISRKRSQD